jgi:hypothetical protein
MLLIFEMLVFKIVQLETEDPAQAREYYYEGRNTTNSTRLLVDNSN